MAPPPADFSLEPGRIRLGDAVLVYLERMFAPSGPLPPTVRPSAYGVAPMAMGEAGVVVAGIPEGEAVWLGFEPLDRSSPVELRVRVGGERGAEVKVVTPPDYSLPGVPAGDGYAPFTEGELSVRMVGDPGAEVTIRLMPAQDFTKMTGVHVDPIDPDSAYKGYRLP
jgi:hypothetical protein